jgi:phosphatidylglycerophosphate synthase
MAFKGDVKKGQSLFHVPETKLKNLLVPLVPKRIETYHLTITTIIWSILIIVSSFLARYNINWLWFTSFMIFAQYITDLLDGEIGRRRKTGLIKWGFYMDHFLDYIFLLSILIGYSMLLPDKYKFILFYIFALFGAFMVNSFLSFAATNEFKIAYLGIGPTEIRLIFIIINTLLIIFGKTYLAPALPYVLFFSTIGLIITVYKTQKYIWKIDMDNLKKESNKRGRK